MKELKITQITEKYNEIMIELGYEHNTIGTRLSESTDGWNLRDMVAEMDYTLSTYYEDGHANEAMRHGEPEEKKMWKNQTAKMKRFINHYEKYIEDMICETNHCSEYDNAEEKEQEQKVEEPKPAEVKRDLENSSEIEFVSKKGIKYLLTIKNGKVRAFTYENGKKIYWSVTKEIQKFMEPYMA